MRIEYLGEYLFTNITRLFDRILSDHLTSTGTTFPSRKSTVKTRFFLG